MPRDKSKAHEKIVKAATDEFLEKGFEKASMKSIADKVGMTSAGLYRHFDNKEDMFMELVKPALDLLDKWRENHVSESYKQIEKEDHEEMWDFSNGLNDVSLILDVMYEKKDLFKLLLCCANGTVYENFMHDCIVNITDEMMRFINTSKDKGLKPYNISKNEMHMLITAYMSALVEPIKHDYSKEEAIKYLKTMADFFTPGWRKVTGL